MLEYVLRALRHVRLLRKVPLGILYYADEGSDADRSAERIRRAAAKAKHVLVLRPGNIGDHMITQRRGQRKYVLILEGKPARLGQVTKQPPVLDRTLEILTSIKALSSKKNRVAVAPTQIQTKTFPLLLPHRVEVTLLLSYLDKSIAEKTEKQMRAQIEQGKLQWRLEQITDRPPCNEHPASKKLAKAISDISQQWEIPFATESSLWPSVAGLVSEDTGVICGAGPVARDLSTPQECVERISVMQRALILTQFLINEVTSNHS
jgi:D-alanine-D-alanine ligase